MSRGQVRVETSSREWEINSLVGCTLILCSMLVRLRSIEPRSCIVFAQVTFHGTLFDQGDGSSCVRVYIPPTSLSRLEVDGVREL